MSSADFFNNNKKKKNSFYIQKIFQETHQSTCIKQFLSKLIIILLIILGVPQLPRIVSSISLLSLVHISLAVVSLLIAVYIGLAISICFLTPVRIGLAVVFICSLLFTFAWQ